MKLHNAQDAIEQAIEGGYLSEDVKGRKAKITQNGHGDFYDIQAGNFEMTLPESALFLDPLFWQALGEARGWNDAQSINWAKDWFDSRINKWHWTAGNEITFWESLP